MKKKRLATGILGLLLLAVLLAGCGSREAEDDGITYFYHSVAETKDTQAEEEPVEKEETFLVTAVDQTGETLQVYRYTNGMEYRYYYGTGTRFYDKYGDRVTISSFEPGTLVTLGMVNTEGILCEARISDEAWVYDDITRFSVDEERSLFKIADTKYSYDEATKVFSGSDLVAMTDLESGDTLSVTGMDKKILAVRITTAQGTLELKNTSLFDGSFVQVGTRIFAEITPDMKMSVPEGTYDLIVANNGWGGSQKIAIVRGQTTTVDLDEMKGKGPTSGKIQFVVDVEDAVLLIDGEKVDYTDPVKLTYGSHSIEVYATDYDVWRRNLYVNSKNSTVVISLKDEEDDSDSTGIVETTPSESVTTESTESSSETESQSESEKRQEELDLLKDLITSLTSTSSLLSD
jgi:hypothetical protein